MNACALPATDLYNARIPRPALIDLARPERIPAYSTPYFDFEGAEFVPVITGQASAPAFLSPDQIVALGGVVPQRGDTLIGKSGRKVWIADQVWMITFNNAGHPVFEQC